VHMVDWERKRMISLYNTCSAALRTVVENISSNVPEKVTRSSDTLVSSNLEPMYTLSSGLCLR